MNLLNFQQTSSHLLSIFLQFSRKDFQRIAREPFSKIFPLGRKNLPQPSETCVENPVSSLIEWWKRLCIVGVSFCVLGCSSSEQKAELERAKTSINQKKYKEAFDSIERILKRDSESPHALEAARLGATINTNETTLLNLELKFLRHIILYSTSDAERIDSQKRIVTIHIEKLGEHSKAIPEINKILGLDINPELKFKMRFELAKAYFQVNQFFQAEVEIDALLENEKDEKRIFELLLFKGNLGLTVKDHTKAINIFDKLIEKYPDLSEKKGVYIQLSAVYEDIGEFHKAIEILQKMRRRDESSELLDLKIKRLKARVLNQPGARGFKR